MYGNGEIMNEPDPIIKKDREKKQPHNTRKKKKSSGKRFNCYCYCCYYTLVLLFHSFVLQPFYGRAHALALVLLSHLLLFVKRAPHESDLLCPPPYHSSSATLPCHCQCHHHNLNIWIPSCSNSCAWQVLVLLLSHHF